MYNNLDYFDTSDYNKEHFCYSVLNKKVPLKFKDELNGKIITEFVGLRSKMYSIKVFNDKKEKKLCKGIKKNVINKKISFEQYK